MSYIPFLYLIGLLTIVFQFGITLQTFWIYPTYLYLLPPLICRLLFPFFNYNKNLFYDDDAFYFYWWLTVQLQVVYLRFPFLEEILRMVPTLYSNWLRLWGGKVGKNNYWSAGVSIMDRPFLDIGNFVVFGYGASISSHLVKNKNGKLELMLSNIIIEDRAMLGGESVMSPGARLGKETLLPGRQVLYPFQEIINGEVSFRDDIPQKISDKLKKKDAKCKS